MSKKKKIVLISILLVVLYVAVEVIRFFSFKYNTEIALEYDASDVVKCTGVFVRDEKLINEEYSPAVHYLLSDGSKISKNYLVAEYYANASDVDTQNKINKLTAERDVLMQSADKGLQASYDVNLVSGEISSAFGEIYDMASTGEFSGFSEIKDKLLVYLNRRRVSLGYDEDYTSRCNEIDAEITLLKSKIVSSPRPIFAPYAGYFVSGSDGFETMLNCDSLDAMTYDEIKNIIDSGITATSQKEYLGKVITNFTWSYAFTTTAEIADRIKKMNSVGVRFSFNGQEEINMAIGNISYSDDKQNASVILKCDLMSKLISSARFYEGEIVFKNSSGLKVPVGAIRMKDGAKGVYIKIGTQIVFKKINPVFENNEFIISKKTPQDTGYLALYDEIVVEGKNLYDGKHIN